MGFVRLAWLAALVTPKNALKGFGFSRAAEKIRRRL
jgi:hypothetical protein